MKLLKIVGAVAVFLTLIVVAVAAVAFSIKNDISVMQNENIAVFLVNPENGNVELGAGFDRSTGEGMLIDTQQRIDDTQLAEVFGNSEERGAGLLLGRKLVGLTYQGGSKVSRVSMRVDRVVLVDDRVVAELLSLAGPQRIELGSEREAFYAYTEVASDELLNVLRGNFGALVWQVEVLNPITGDRVVRRMSTDELLSLTDKLGISIGEDLIKTMILLQVFNEAKPTLQKEEVRLEVVRTLLREYKQGGIRTYPANTLTRVLKLVPEGAVFSFLEGRM